MLVHRGAAIAVFSVVALHSTAAAWGALRCGDVDLEAWTSAHADPGYHVLCFPSPGTGSETCAADGSDVSCSEGITVFWAGLRSARGDLGPRLSPQHTLLDFEELMISRHELSNPSRYTRLSTAFKKKKRWDGLFAFYALTGDGEAPVRIKEHTGLGGAVLVFEGSSVGLVSSTASSATSRCTRQALSHWRRRSSRAACDPSSSRCHAF